MVNNSRNIFQRFLLKTAETTELKPQTNQYQAHCTVLMNDNVRPVFYHLLENFIKSFLIGHLNISPLRLKDATLYNILISG